MQRIAGAAAIKLNGISPGVRGRDDLGGLRAVQRWDVDPPQEAVLPQRRHRGGDRWRGPRGHQNATPARLRRLQVLRELIHQRGGKWVEQVGVVNDDEGVICLVQKRILGQKRIQCGLDEYGGFPDLGDSDQGAESSERDLRLGCGADHPHRTALSQPFSDLRGQRRFADAIDTEQGDPAGIAFGEQLGDLVHKLSAQRRRPRDRHSRTLWPQTHSAHQ